MPWSSATSFRILFCMFASDVGLLPPGIVTEVINANLSTAKEFADDWASRSPR